MGNEILSLMFALVGCLIILFRKPYVRSIIKFQNSRFGLHYGEREIERSARIAILVGSAFIVFGLMGALNIKI